MAAEHVTVWRDPQQLPPGLSPNGHRPSERLAELMEKLPQMVYGAFAAVLQQQPVTTVSAQQHLCHECLGARFAFERQHGDEIRTAMGLAAKAAGVEPGSPQASQVDFAPFLPERLQPGQASGLPAINPSITTVAGSEVCQWHIPGVQSGRRPLLIASAGVNLGAFGMPG